MFNSGSEVLMCLPRLFRMFLVLKMLKKGKQVDEANWTVIGAKKSLSYT